MYWHKQLLNTDTEFDNKYDLLKLKSFSKGKEAINMTKM